MDPKEINLDVKQFFTDLFSSPHMRLTNMVAVFYSQYMGFVLSSISYMDVCARTCVLNAGVNQQRNHRLPVALERISNKTDELEDPQSAHPPSPTYTHMHTHL